MHATQKLREIADRVASALRFMENIDQFERAQQSRHYNEDGIAATNKLIAMYRPALAEQLAAISELVDSLKPPAAPADAVMRALGGAIEDSPAAREAVALAVTGILNVHGARGERLLTDEERNLLNIVALHLDQTKNRGQWRTVSDPLLICFTICTNNGLEFLSHHHEKMTVARALARDSVLPILVDHCTDDVFPQLQEQLELLSSTASDRTERIEALKLAVKICEALATASDEPAPR